MKKKALLLICSMTALATACTNEISLSIEENENKNEIRIISRSTDQSISFQSQDSIGLYLLIGKNTLSDSRYCNNIKFTCSGSVFTSSQAPRYPSTKDICTFIAYAPYSPNKIEQGQSTITVEIQSDQSTTENYSTSDFLVAKQENVTPSNAAIELNYNHKLSLVTLRINGGVVYTADELLAADPYVRLVNTYTKATYDFATDQFSNLNTPKDITPNGEWEVKDGTLVGKQAILLPQDCNETTLILCNIKGTTYKYELDSSHPLLSEGHQDILFTLNKTTIPYIQVNGSINDWPVAEIRNEEMPESNDLFIDSRSGHVYHAVQIGSQSWMAENLHETRLTDGSSISSSYVVGLDNKQYYYLPSIFSNDKLCPTGWRMPTDDDFKILKAYLGNNSTSIKSTTLWSSLPGDNSTGMNLFPYGYIPEKDIIGEKSLCLLGGLYGTTGCFLEISDSNNEMTIKTGNGSKINIRCIKQ